MRKRYRLRNVEVTHLAIVNKGANGKRFFLKKSDSDTERPPQLTLPSQQRLVKNADWSTVYCCVAEPDAIENGGLLAPDVEDVWESPDEIRKAAHGFMRNGGLITQMHDSLEPYGQLVESAVALEDFTVEGETIKKGTWYVAIEPTQAGKDAIEKGDFTGVSLDGQGERIEADLITKELSPADRRGLLQKFAEFFGLAEPADLGTVRKQTPEEEPVDEATQQKIDESATNSKEALEKASAAVTAIAALKDTMDQVLARLPEPEKAPPTVEDVQKQFGDLLDKVSEVAQGVNLLAQGSSAQPNTTAAAPASTEVSIAKSDKTGPIGLLSD